MPESDTNLCRRPFHLVLLGTMLLVCAMSSGCVQRRILVRSNPPGAQVYIDNYEIGTTPCSTSFTYYGTREIRVVKDGYETLVVRQPFPTPWYQYVPIDFVTENLWPQEIRDERVVDYTLIPQRIEPTSQLLGRAEQLRHQTAPRPPAILPGGFNPGGPNPSFNGGFPIPPPVPFTPSNSSPSGAQWPSDAIK